MWFYCVKKGVIKGTRIKLDRNYNIKLFNIFTKTGKKLTTKSQKPILFRMGF